MTATSKTPMTTPAPNANHDTDWPLRSSLTLVATDLPFTPVSLCSLDTVSWYGQPEQKDNTLHINHQQCPQHFCTTNWNTMSNPNNNPSPVTLATESDDIMAPSLQQYLAQQNTTVDHLGVTINQLVANINSFYDILAQTSTQQLVILHKQLVQDMQRLLEICSQSKPLPTPWQPHKDILVPTPLVMMVTP